MKLFPAIDLAFFVISLAVAACATSNQSNQAGSFKKAPFGALPTGQKVDLFTLTNASGMTVKVTNYGGIITHLLVADKNGVFEDVVLGYDSLAGYLAQSPYFGAIVGRYGNRIARGRFSLDGKPYQLATNNAPNSLHGGLVGFDKVIWEAKEVKVNGGIALKLTYTSKDGEAGFPGTLTTAVTYTLRNDNSLRFDYEAITDQPTVINLTNHSYFNLTGGTKRDVLAHQMRLSCQQFIPIDAVSIPTGQLAAVKNTPFGFNNSKPIGQHINDVANEQIRHGAGFDHCFVIDQLNDTNKTVPFAEVFEPTSGRTMTIETTEPGVQFYTGNFLDGSIIGKDKVAYQKRYGFCLETQHFPDSPNQPQFPSVVLRPGQTYRSSTIHRFFISKQ